jgi:hypothetical protein
VRAARLAECESEQAGIQQHEAGRSWREESVGHEVMITHRTPAATDAGPNLLKISESAFCGGVASGAIRSRGQVSPRTMRGEGAPQT